MYTEDAILLALVAIFLVLLCQLEPQRRALYARIRQRWQLRGQSQDDTGTLGR